MLIQCIEVQGITEEKEIKPRLAKELEELKYKIRQLEKQLKEKDK